MLEFEQTLVTPHTSTNMLERQTFLKKVMHIVDDERDRPLEPLKLDRQTGMDLCGVLCAYRLLDVLYDLKHPDSVKSNPRHSKFTTKGLRPDSTVRDGKSSPDRYSDDNHLALAPGELGGDHEEGQEQHGGPPVLCGHEETGCRLIRQPSALQRPAQFAHAAQGQQGTNQHAVCRAAFGLHAQLQQG